MLTRSALTQSLQDILSPLNLGWQFRPNITTGVGFAKGDVWSRAARRKHKSDSLPDAEDEDEEESGKASFVFKIRLKEAKAGTEVDVRWLQGFDSVLFESFCGMLKRQMTT